MPEELAASNSPLVAIEKHSIGEKLVKTVDARELWKWLGVASLFHNWLKRRLEETKAVESVDFIVSKFGCGNSKGLTGATLPFEPVEYYLTLNAAKLICQLEKTDKGHQIRQYFIDAELELQAVKAEPIMALPQTRIEALKELVASLEREEEQKKLIAKQSGEITVATRQLEAQAPAVDFHEKFVNSTKLFGLRETGNAFGLHQTDFITRCKADKIIYRLAGKWAPMQKFTPHFMDTRFGVAEKSNAATSQAFFTTRGLDWVAKRLGLVTLTDAQKAAMLAAKETE